MNYFEWAEEYMTEARNVLAVIEKKKLRMKEERLTSDERKSLNDTLIAYRCIYRELLSTARKLRQRAGEQTDAA